MVSELRQIRIALANLEVQLEDFIAQAKQINEEYKKLKQQLENDKRNSNTKESK